MAKQADYPNLTQTKRGNKLRKNSIEKFDTAHIFPEHPAIRPRGPLPKQRLVYYWIRSGEATGGGIVYQGGKGCAKTLCGVGAVLTCHLNFPGLRSAVGRESYPSLLTSTWDEFREGLSRIPKQLIKKVSKPSINSMGTVEWWNGGVTLFISLSNSDTWESANFGFVWVDEAHRQREVIVEFLSSRIRQDNAPRVMLLTTNPAGRNWIYRWGNPKSKKRLPKWLWVESNMFENPALPADYVQRMEARYRPGTAGHKRWVLGLSSALEGAVFDELFFADPEDLIHVIPDHPIPDSWERGRGLDWGIDNPCFVTWGAWDKRGDLYIYRCHTGTGQSAKWHGQRILELEEGETMEYVPADPEIFRKIHPVAGLSGVFFSTADEFLEVGCDVTVANNDRKLGLSLLLDAFALDEKKVHPCTLVKGAPSIYILSNPTTEPLIDSIEAVEWREEPKTGNTDAPDDIKKKNDHGYDSLRYLVAEKAGGESKEPVSRKPPETKGSGTYRGY